MTRAREADGGAVPYREVRNRPPTIDLIPRTSMPSHSALAAARPAPAAGKWEAEIRRKDGKEMRVEGTTKAVFTTMLAPSSSEAIGLAYQAIDGNKISVAGWI